MQSNEVLEALYQTIIDRREQPKEGSYTCYLFEKGLDKILKKVGEECSETIIAAKNGDNGQRRDPALRCPGGIGQAQRENRQSKNFPSGR